MGASIRAGLAGTPGRLRAVGIVSVVATLLFGLAAGQAFRSADGALDRAAANSDQLVRIQAIQTDVIQADADATNAFLVGGLEPAAQREDYTTAIASASRLIAEAAQHQPADGTALGALNQALVAYTSQVEQARANNRQALPVGAQYLRSASADLRADALPLLKNLGEANNARVAEEFDRAARAALWLVIPGLLTLLVLGLALVWLARRTRRYVNLPLAAAALVVLVTAGGRHGRAPGGQGGRRHHPRRRLRRHAVHGAGPHRRVRRQVEREPHPHRPRLGRRVREGLAGLEHRRQRRAHRAGAEPGILRPEPPAVVRVRLGPPADPRARRRPGTGTGRSTLATGTGPGTGNATFAAFDTSSDAQLAALSGQTSQQLDDAGGWLPLAGALGLLAGVVAAACAWWGVSLRLEEYR